MIISNRVSGIRNRSPRLKAVTQTGYSLGVTAARIFSTDSLSADRFVLSAVLPAGSDGERQHWIAGSAIEVDIAISPDQNAPYQGIIQGRVDQVTLDPLHNTLHLTGRDFSASLLQHPLRETFVNQTASEIVKHIAGQHNLEPRTTASYAMIGRTDNGGHTKFTLPRHTSATTHWDLLADLARSENYDLYVFGRQLHFHPRSSSLNETAKQLHCGDAIDVRFQRVLPMSATPTVSVESWNAKTQTVIKHFEEFHVNGDLNPIASDLISSGSTLHIMRPNLARSDAELLARQYGGDLLNGMSHLELTVPGDVNLRPREHFILTGSSGLDGTYRIASLESSFHNRRGFIQKVTAHTM